MKQKIPSITADALRGLSASQLQKILKDLGPEQSEELKYTWEFWARGNQLEPSGSWDYWVFNAGRGAG